MKKSIVVIILLIFASSDGNTQKSEKIPSLGFYPEVYKKFDADSWPEIQTLFDSLLDIKSLDDLRHSILRWDIWFLFSRIRDISWTNQDIDIISSYLLNFFEAGLSGKGFITQEDLEIFEKNISNYNYTDPIFFPQMAIWSTLSIDVNNSCQVVNSFFFESQKVSHKRYFQTIRSSTIIYASEYFKNIEVVKLFRNIKLKYSSILTPQELNIIEETLVRFEAHQLKNEKETWEFLWINMIEAKKKDNIDHEILRLSYQSNLIMIEIYGKPNIPFLQEIVESTSDPLQKYCFLYNACFLMKNRFSSRIEINREIIQKQKILVDKFYNSNKDWLDKSVSPENDFLKIIYDYILEIYN